MGARALSQDRLGRKLRYTAAPTETVGLSSCTAYPVRFRGPRPIARPPNVSKEFAMNDHKVVAAILTAAFWTSRQKAPDPTDETQLLEKYRWFLKQLGPSEQTLDGGKF
jgi:hypothetical protein